MVGKVMEQKVEAPFIGLVPIPSLLIDRVDVDFQMEVTDTNTEKSNSSAEVSTNISSKWFGVKVDVAGKVSSSRENTRSTNQTAKYQVHVTASQQPQTEGLSKLMDIMAACIEPVPTMVNSRVNKNGLFNVKERNAGRSVLNESYFNGIVTKLKE